MKLRTIASSSSGNCTLVYTPTTAILIDCGIAVKYVTAGLDEVIELPNCDLMGVLVTHSHSDHVANIGPLIRKFPMPVYAHEVTVKEKPKAFEGCTIHHIVEGVQFKIGDFTIDPFSTKHDVHSLGFRITDGTKTLTYLTDSGSISKVMKQAMSGADALFIECDYDTEEMTKCADYDQLLKDRITSDYGHLSTQQVIEYLATIDLSKMGTVIAGHLSKTTNSPEIVMKHFGDSFPQYLSKFKVAPLENTIDI